MSTSLAERAQERPVTAAEAKETVKGKSQELREQASSRAREELDARTNSVAEQVRSFSQTMRRTASELRSQRQDGQAAMLDQMAMRANQVADYLTEADSDRLVEGAKQLGGRGVEVVRRQKWLIAPIGLGVGLFAARMLTSKGGNDGDSGGS